MSTKLHLAITGDFHVVERLLSAGDTADIVLADELTAEVFGCHVVEDRGYDCDRHRDKLRANGNVPVIPGHRNRKLKIGYDKTLSKRRSRIERLFGKISGR